MKEELGQIHRKTQDVYYRLLSQREAIEKQISLLESERLVLTTSLNDLSQVLGNAKKITQENENE